MSDLNWEQAETIVDQALDLPEAERKKFVESQCEGDPELKGEVTLLLESIFDSEGWLDDPRDYKREFYKEISDDVGLLSTDHSLIGKQVGAYTIREKIGEGGMGTVYRAERRAGEFDHRVAVKIIRRGQATELNIRRFNREQRILAGLQHPGIARLYDGGVTDDGFPYIIMEHVSGTPIDDYCRANNCSIDEKIALFKQVLEAIRHAHENLVIHRDLKPGNILVDEDGNVKILDFGISKLLEEESDISLTQTGAHLLTPRYAAPEQIRRKNITTATDLYALGVVFYELLTGAGPYNLEDASRFESQQVIINEEPSKPSHSVDSPTLQKKLKGDLDAIALKAIRKEPDRRYRVAETFLDDLKHYQTDNPISARTDSLKYRSQKFFKRHKKAVAVAAGILLLIIGFAGFYTWRITEERNQAQFEAQRAEEITSFLVSMLELNNPSENSGDEITINDALDRGIDYLKQQEMSLLNQATILGTIGSIQLNNGNLEKAGQNLGKAVASIVDSPAKQTKRTLLTATEYAEWQKTVGNMEKAEQYFLITDSLYKENRLRNSISFLKHRLNYSDFLLEIGQYQKALTLLSELSEFFQNFDLSSQSAVDLLADLYNNRGRALKNLGKNKEALQNLDQALKLKQKIYNEENPKIAKLYHNMGVVYTTITEFPKAMKMARKAYQIRIKVYDPTHQLVGSTLQLLGNIAIELGNYDQAQNYIEQSVAISKKQHGADHFRYALAIREYAKVLSQTGRFESALKQIERAAKIIEGNFGSSHLYYGFILNTYGDIHYREGNYQKAMTYGEETILNFKQNFGNSHPNLGKVYADQGKYALKSQRIELADSLLTKSIAILKRHFDPSNTFLKEADSLLRTTNKKQNL